MYIQFSKEGEFEGFFLDPGDNRIEISDEVHDTYMAALNGGRSLCLQNGEIQICEPQPTEPSAQLRILMLMHNLSDTDYLAIKFAEGALSESEYAPMRAQRQAWRDEINRLEAETGAGQ